MKKRVVPFLSTQPEKGKNTVIVAHDDPFEAATGIYPDPHRVYAMFWNPKERAALTFLVLWKQVPGS